jgi:aminotransferase
MDALAAGDVHYSSNYGTPALRAAIARKLQRENDIIYSPDGEIIVTVGANEAVLLAFMAFLDPGDEVLVPDPAWLHYRWCAQLCGATAVPVPCSGEHGFVPDPAEVVARITPRTRMLVVNSPNNPTGAVYPDEVLRALGALAVRSDLLVLSDEIYEQMVYAGAYTVSLASLPDLYSRTITVNGFSKSYSMTGWRLGYVAAPRELCDVMIRVHQYTTVCATSFAQAGAAVAYDGPQDPRDAMIAAFARRREIVVSGLNEIPGITCVEPRGAFYAFPRVEGGGDMHAFVDQLLEETGVALVPGDEFGAAGANHVRLSYAASEEDLREGLRRIRDWVGRRV